MCILAISLAERPCFLSGNDIYPSIGGYIHDNLRAAPLYVDVDN